MTDHSSAPLTRGVDMVDRQVRRYGTATLNKLPNST